MSSESDSGVFLGSECSSDVNYETYSESGEDMEVVHSRFEPYDGEPLQTAMKMRRLMMVARNKTLQFLTALHQKYLQKDSVDKFL